MKKKPVQSKSKPKKITPKAAAKADVTPTPIFIRWRFYLLIFFILVALGL